MRPVSFFARLFPPVASSGIFLALVGIYLVFRVRDVCFDSEAQLLWARGQLSLPSLGEESLLGEAVVCVLLRGVGFFQGKRLDANGVLIRSFTAFGDVGLPVFFVLSLGQTYQILQTDGLFFSNIQPLFTMVLGLAIFPA